jgi:hypothetical protein
MQVLAQADQRSAAMDVYQTCRRVLAWAKGTTMSTEQAIALALS